MHQPGSLRHFQAPFFSTMGMDMFFLHKRFAQPGGYDSFSPRPKLQSRGCSAGAILGAEGLFWPANLYTSAKTFWDGKDPQNSVIYIYIYYILYACNIHMNA